MPLVSGFDVLRTIKEKQVIAGAFNTTNIETTLGILDAFEKSNVPGYIQLTPNNLKFIDFSYISDIVKRRAKDMVVPVALHLDHGRNFEDVKHAIDSGFTSVMIDGSELPYEENVRVTKEAADYARLFNVPLEAELGAISGREGSVSLEDALHTDPDQLKDFVDRTGCSSVAVSVGNVHGLNTTAKLDFELLEKLSKASSVPLVIHGASGLSDEDINRMIEFNVAKINIASDMRKAYLASLGTFIDQHPGTYDILSSVRTSTKAVEDTVYQKLRAINNLND